MIRDWKSNTVFHQFRTFTAAEYLKIHGNALTEQCYARHQIMCWKMVSLARSFSIDMELNDLDPLPC